MAATVLEVHEKSPAPIRQVRFRAGNPEVFPIFYAPSAKLRDCHAKLQRPGHVFARLI